MSELETTMDLGPGVIVMPEDIDQLVADLAPVQEKWREIGKELGLQEHDLNNLQSQISRPVDRLHAIISSWQSTLQATWSAMVHALKSRSVNAPHLAAQLQIKHYPSGAAGSKETEGKVESRFKFCVAIRVYTTYVHVIVIDRSRS